MPDTRVCLYCGRGVAELTSLGLKLRSADLLAQTGIWACDDHKRSDGWVNRPHEAPPFDVGYPHELLIPSPPFPSFP